MTWRASIWGDEISLEYGKALRGYESARGPVRVFGSNGPVGWTDKALAAGPGVILGRKGAYRGVQYSEADFFVIDTAYYVVPKTDLDMRWLYYAIQHHKLGEIDDGSPIPSTTRAAVYVRELDVPPKDVQREMARILGSVDDKIDLNRRINQTLEAMAQAIFKSWFVDFDPVKAKIAAKAESRDPLRAAISAISGKSEPELVVLPPEEYEQLAATAALFPDEMEESELGEIPRGWRVGAIGDLVETVGGATPDTKNIDFWEPSEFAWTTPKDLSGLSSPVLLKTERKISKRGVNKIGSGLLPVGTLIMSSRAPIGYLALAQMPVAINQGYIAMLPCGVLPPLYLLFWCRENMEAIKGNANGSTFLEISKKAFRPLSALQPSPQVVSEFVRRIEPLISRIVASERESANLTSLRDTLLPKLLSGELSVASIDTEPCS
jgi:type I restriction enzyme, S subunit